MGEMREMAKFGWLQGLRKGLKEKKPLVVSARWELMGLPIEGVEFLDAGVADKQRGFVWG